MLKSSSEPSFGSTSLTNIPTKFTHPSKLRIIKNLAVISVSWWLLFSAYDGLVMLQSTLNSSQGIGVISVSVQHACSCVTALLFPKYLIRKLGSKVVIVAAIVSHAPYIAANFYSHWILMIVTSVLLGAANPLLWAALCANVNNLSVLYTGHIKDSEKPQAGGTLYGHQPIRDESVQKDMKLDASGDISQPVSTQYGHHYVEPTRNESVQKYTKLDASGNISQPVSTQYGHHYVEPTRNESIQKDTKLDASGYISSSSSTILESTTARFFGFHGMAYSLCFVTSNVTSYFILSIGVEGKGYVKNSTCSCGSGFCNDQVACFDANLKPPSDTIRHIITTVCVVLVVLSVTLVVVWLDDVGKREKVPISLELMSATCRLMKNSKMFLLIPMMLYLGIAQGFFMGDYTQAYVGCSWGIHNVGLVAATFGATFSLSSTCSGLVVKYVGRPPIFLFAAVLKVVAVALLLSWTPDADRPSLMFLVAALFGLILGSYWSQLRAFMGIIFREDEEAAFGNYQLWHSVGASVAFGYSKYLCTSIKIYILLFVSTLAIMGYLLVERSYARTKQK